ncbi:hypothetical protein Gotur_034712 [Gossypium turneri]
MEDRVVGRRKDAFENCWAGKDFRVVTARDPGRKKQRRSKS